MNKQIFKFRKLKTGLASLGICIGILAVGHSADAAESTRESRIEARDLVKQAEEAVKTVQEDQWNLDARIDAKVKIEQTAQNQHPRLQKEYDKVANKDFNARDLRALHRNEVRAAEEVIQKVQEDPTNADSRINVERRIAETNEAQQNRLNKLYDNAAKIEFGNHLELDEATTKIGQTKITGQTIAGSDLSYEIDGIDMTDFENELPTADENGIFHLTLKNPLLYGQEITVHTNRQEILWGTYDEAPFRAKDLVGDGTAKQTFTLPRYEKSYQIPTTQLSQVNGHHRVYVEPILAGASKVIGHTSANGKVFLQVNGQPVKKTDGFAEQVESILMTDTDEKGRFELKLDETFFKKTGIKVNDTVTVVIMPDGEEADQAPIFFNVKAKDIKDVAKATQSYKVSTVRNVRELKGKKELAINTVYGESAAESERGTKEEKEKGLRYDTDKGDKHLTGTSKYKNAIVQVLSSTNPELIYAPVKVGNKGAFTVDGSFIAGQKLWVMILDPKTGGVLVSQEVEVDSRIQAEESTPQDPSYYKEIDGQKVGFTKDGLSLSTPEYNGTPTYDKVDDGVTKHVDDVKNNQL